MQKLIGKVQQWADARNLITGTTPEKQTLKLVEEVGELCQAILKNDRAAAVDGIGDVTVVLINLCTKLDLTLEQCLAAAYDEIKDRQGSMVNGAFVKIERGGE